MCQSPRSFPCQPPCLHLRPPAGASLRTPGPLRAPLQPLGPALPSCRGVETDTWPAPQGNAGALGPHPLLGHKPGHLGVLLAMLGPPAPTRLRPAGAGCAGAAPGSPRLRPPPSLPSWAVCSLSVHRRQCPLGAGRLERWRVRPPACLPPAETPAAPSHTCSICRPSFSRPPRQAPLPQLPEASQGVSPSLLPPPHRSLPAAAPARGIRLSMVAGDRCLPSPGCSPSTGRPPGAKPPTPDPRSLGSSTRFALCTNHICHL